MIKNFRISSLSNEINVEINFNENAIKSIFFFTRDTFETDNGIDITYKINGTYPEIFTIRPEDVNLNYFTDIYFITINYEETEECSLDCSFETGVAVNTTKYVECILNLLLKLKIENCSFFINCSNVNIDKIMLKQLLLDSLLLSLQDNNYKLAIKIMEQLDTLCYNCECVKEFNKNNLNTFGIYTTSDEENCEIGNFKKEYGNE